MAVSRRGKGRGRKKNVEKEAAEPTEVDTNAAANEGIDVRDILEKIDSKN